MGRAITILLLSVLISSTSSVFAGLPPPPIEVILGPNGESPQIPIELLQLDLISSRPIPFPLASDPANVLGDSVDGYGFVDSKIIVSLSPSSSALGSMQLKINPPGSASGPTLISSGQSFQVDSFFDITYDITLIDIDTRPGRDFIGQPDGASILLPNNGPVRLAANYECFAQLTDPLMGCMTQLSNKLFVGGLPLVIPLGVDVNGNGNEDKIKITRNNIAMGPHLTLDFTPPNGPYAVSYDSFFDIAGSVGDLRTDPPFAGVLDLDFDGPAIILVPAPGALPPLPPFPSDDNPQVVGGEIIPIDSTALLLAATQTSISWLLPLLLGGAGLFVFRLRKNQQFF